MLHEMNVLVKMAQSRTMYIAEYTNVRKLAVHGYMVPFRYVSKMGQTTIECCVSRDRFNDIVILVKHNLIQIAQSLSSEIRE